jgi:DNA-binding MarR family transcriptional regulator
MVFANPLDTHLGYQLRRASNALMSGLSRKLAAVEVTPAEASVLIVISANGGITQSELGRQLGIKRANMVPLTSALELRGLVARSPAEGRSVDLKTTSKGRTTAAAAERIMLENDRALFGHMSERDVLLMRRFMSGIPHEKREPA